jgi:hypothetical protein
MNESFNEELDSRSTDRIVPIPMAPIAIGISNSTIRYSQT